MKLLPPLAVTAAALLLWLCWPQDAVEITLPEQRCYLDSPQFSLQWRHSVEHQLWREYYRSDGQTLHLERTEMQTFGAGVPADGISIPASEAGFTAFKSTVSLNETLWTVSANMQGEIRTASRTWPVYRQVPDYTAIRIAPAQAARAAVWWKTCYESVSN